MKRGLVIGIVVMLLVLVGAGIVLGSMGSGAAVLTCGDFELDNTGFAYYYWSEFFYFSEAYGEYLDGVVDFSQPLDGQAYDETRSWEDYLVEEAVTTVRDTMAMVFQAEAEGFSMPADYDGTYQQVLLDFSVAAQEGGYGSLDGYLKASYGKGASEESFADYLYNAHLAAAYADHLLEQAMPTDEEARAYFSQRQGEYLELYTEIDPGDESTWLEIAAEDLQNENYQNAFLTICDQYDFLVNYDAVVLTAPEGIYG